MMNFLLKLVNKTVIPSIFTVGWVESNPYSLNKAKEREKSFIKIIYKN